MAIEIFITSKKHAEDLICELLEEFFLIESSTAPKLYYQRIRPTIERLKDNVFLVAETNYVDKVYRDSYYSYYSSKLLKYARDCIRISIFSEEVREEEFRTREGTIALQEKYLGYFLLRPTEPAILGRNLIAPQAFKANDILCVTTRFQLTVNGVKLYVDGFPHSSQDTETITCAETTLWSIMEYFSHRYPEYKPVLPAQLIQTLKRVSSERQIPSKGLNIQQMSYALREFGFGTRVYSKDEYGADFNILLSCYIESGIPLIIAIQDRTSGIGHALVCIGRKPIENSKIDSLTLSALKGGVASRARLNNVEILEYGGIERDYVFVDDNHSVYQVASLDAPALHYEQRWHSCKITFFIVPLYPKVHLEADQARAYILQSLINGQLRLEDGSKVIMRLFLASSRTFKDTIAQNATVNSDIREIILATPMPKFVWVCELTDRKLLKQRQANGIIILDATEANINFNKPLILAAYQDKIIWMDAESKNLDKNPLTLGSFSIFTGNLRSSEE